MKVDIHKNRYKLDSQLEKIKASGEICEESKQDILRFKSHCFAKGLSNARIWKYLFHLYYIAKKLAKPFREATKDDIIRVIEGIERREWSDWTKHDYRVVLKRFYRWLNDDEDYPKEVKWINTNFNRRNNMLPQELLTENDVKKLAGAADNSRDKALVLVLYESGCRIGELLSLRIKDVQFDEYGAVLLVTGKTGMRRVRIIVSASTLTNWLDHHPFRNDPQYPVWVNLGTTNKYRPMGYPAVFYILKQIAKRAGVKKKVNPHAFRHARATHLASKLTEAQMKEYLGWVQGSDMASVYVHMSGRDVDKALLKLHGLAQDEDQKEEIFKVRTCPKCKERNDPVSLFCKRCGSPMDLRMALDLQEKRNEKDEVVALVVKELVRKLEIEKMVYETIKQLGLEEKFERV